MRKYEVRKVEISFDVFILKKLILLDTYWFLLICAFTMDIKKVKYCSGKIRINLLNPKCDNKNSHILLSFIL